MTVANYLANPWKGSHGSFDDAFFSMHRAPEFSTGEVVLSSLYRASGFEGIQERAVKGFGDALSKAADKAKRSPADGERIQPDTWRTVLDRLVQSPKVSQQSSKRFMSLSPIVPDVALYSGAARLAGSPWNPGELVKHIVRLGAPSEEGASTAWEKLHDSLGVGESDDVWARWLGAEFLHRRMAPGNWKIRGIEPLTIFPQGDREAFKYPAKQLFADLGGIIAAKNAMTRRQWVSLFEAVLRIGTVSHVLWVCDVNHRIWMAVRDLLEGGASELPATDADAARQLLNVKGRMLSFGHRAVPTLRDYASKYMSARLGLNCVLWALHELGVPDRRLGSIREIRLLLADIATHRDGIAGKCTMDAYYQLQDREVRTIACKKGAGSNLMEFAQYTLGQRQTMDETLRGYDQGYFLRKKSAARNSQWVLGLGPAAVLAMAHCCLHEVDGPRSVQRLAQHLSSYGIEFDLQGLNESDLGRQLRMLGLVLDSPDAESGMLLVPPFSIR